MWYCNQYIHHQISSMFLTWAHLCGSLHRGGQAPGENKLASSKMRKLETLPSDLLTYLLTDKGKV